MDKLIRKPMKPDADGMLHLPEGPGLGVELDREAMREFSV